jgi:hypothetical protein
MNTDPIRRWQIPRQHCLPRNLKVPKTAGFSDSPLSNLWEEVRDQIGNLKLPVVLEYRDRTNNRAKPF